MELELVNPFVEASYEVVKSFIPDGITKSDIDLLDKNTILKGVAVRIPFKGKDRSAVLINMENSVAEGLVALMTDESFVDWNDYTLSALGEFANLVCGSAVTKLDNSSLDLDIEPPSVVFTNSATAPVIIENEAMDVKIETQLGVIQVIVYLEQIF